MHPFKLICLTHNDSETIKRLALHYTTAIINACFSFCIGPFSIQPSCNITTHNSFQSDDRHFDADPKCSQDKILTSPFLLSGQKYCVLEDWVREQALETPQILMNSKPMIALHGLSNVHSESQFSYPVGNNIVRRSHLPKFSDILEHFLGCLQTL